MLVQNSKNSSETTHPCNKTLMLVTQLTQCCSLWFSYVVLLTMSSQWVRNHKKDLNCPIWPHFFPHLLWWPNHQANVNLVVPLMFPRLFTPRNGTLFYSVHRSTKLTPSRAYPIVVYRTECALNDPFRSTRNERFYHSH